MRPVMLRMEGFAAFREATVVDFRDADYFVLVGPTGSGKSTVIDAMTFALYGSVPRWDDQRTVSLALAPTAGRGTVSLVFDVGGVRYVAARELRRAKSGSVTVKEARLDRLADPSGTAEPEDDTVSLASGGSGVTGAVATLLGLPFDDFCTCVVLPQGDFADFLHAAPNERQKKLERILGLGVYDAIMRRANTEAARQNQRAEWLGEQLTGFADATADAEERAGARVDALEALERRVEERVPMLTAAATATAGSQADADRLETYRARLVALAAPPDLAALDARRRAAADARDATAAAALEAERADTAARDALRAAPRRGPLEQALRDHAELATLDARRPGLVTAHDDARDAAEVATRAAEAARAAVDDARGARDQASDGHDAAAGAVAAIGAERDALRRAVAPEGLDRLDHRQAAAVGARDVAADRVRTAEAEETRAREAVAAAPARGPLEQARRDHATLAAARDDHAAALDRRSAASREATGAHERADTARRLRDDAQDRLEQARRSDVAAVLRPTLVAGEHCPVCAQTIDTLPDAPPAGDLDAAVAALAEAEQTHDRARDATAAADAAVQTATAQVTRAATIVEGYEKALADAPDPAAVDTVLADLDQLAGDVDTAADTARAARHDRDSALAALDEVRDDIDSAARALRSTRDPLVALGAPDPDADVPATWRALVAWAAGAAASRDEALPAATARQADAARSLEDATAAFATAGREAAAARARETAAARAEQGAHTALDTARRRADDVRAVLADAPTAASASAELERLSGLERDARTADAAVREARTAVTTARDAAAAVGAEIERAWQALSAARDPLVALGAPSIAGDDLAAAWRDLTGWATDEAARHDRDLARVREELADARVEYATVERRLAQDLADHDVEPVGDDLARAAPVAVVAALGRARGARDRIAERRATVGELTAQREQAVSDGQVAKLLGDQLRSNHFPRWLVASALDALVADASRTLADLSGGQFALTHDRGEFFVVDHADADSARPVKTLSGGETFQASLALALALSSQLAGLAAEGAARLESIVLDEGFGTLDDANLDVVASTLENLATTGGRTVGVITHVAALAERVPTRFVVRRDQHGSGVVREGA